MRLDHLAMDPGDVIVGGHGLQHAGFHPLTKAGLFSHVKGGCDATNQRRGGGVANALYHDVVGAFPGILPGEHHHPATLGGHHGVVTLVVGVGSLGSEAGQRGIYQLGMTRSKGVVVNAQPSGDSWPEVFDDNVGYLRQFPGIIPAVLGLQVEDDAFLAAIPLDGPRRPPEFFSTRRLNFDDFSAEVGHHHGGDATGPAAGKVKDGDAIKNLCHGAPLVVNWPSCAQMHGASGSTYPIIRVRPAQLALILAPTQ